MILPAVRSGTACWQWQEREKTQLDVGDSFWFFFWKEYIFCIVLANRLSNVHKPNVIPFLHTDLYGSPWSDFVSPSSDVLLMSIS